MGKKKITQDKEDYKEKLAKLLEELDGQAIPGNPMTEEERHRKMSNPQIRYAICNNTIHDKQCPIIKGVSSEFIRMQHDYSARYKQCPTCACRAYIHYGAEDIDNYKKYLELFATYNMTPSNLRRFYMNRNCKTKLDSNILTVRKRDDTWKIIPLETKGMVRLLHNNYKTNPDGTREFIDGYHIQKDNINIKSAIDILAMYKYEKNNDKHLRDFSCEAENQARKRYVQLSFIQKLRYQFRRLVMNHYGLNSEVHIDGFKSVNENGFPQDGTLCTYIWESKSKDRYWMIGIYSEGKKAFCATFLENRKTIKQRKVIAWKAMSNDDFMI